MQQTVEKKPISIRRALKIVASDNYDKKNIFFYFIFVVVGTVLSYYGQEKGNPNLICLFSGIFISLLSGAIYIIAMNNAIHKRKGVFPSILQNASSIFKTTGYLFIGNLFWIFVMPMIFSLLMYPVIGIVGLNPAKIMFVAIIPMLIILTLLYGVYFNFVISLSLYDLFNFKKAFLAIRKAKKYVG